MAETNLPIFGPVEDLMLGILRPFFEDKGVLVAEAFYEGMTLPAVIPLHSRRSGNVGFQNKDQAFTEPALIEMNTICEGPEAKRENAELQEAVKHALFLAWRRQIVVPGVGVINRIQAGSKATEQSDWATSTGVVQYSTLPASAIRYEAIYKLLLRPDRSSSTTNRFLTPTN
jgi:hypothetical protein